MRLQTVFPSTVVNNETVMTLLVFFGSYPITYGVNILLTRALGPANYGDFAVTRSVATLVATVTLLGLNKASLNLLPVYRKRGDHDVAKGFILVSLLAILTTGLVLSVLGFGITQALATRSSGETHPVRIAMFWVVPMSLGIYAISVLSGHERIIASSLLDRIMLPLITSILVGGVLIFGESLTDMWAVQLLILARILLVFILVWLLWTIWRREYREIGPSFEVKDWAGTIFPFLLPAIVIAALGQTSMFVLEAHHPNEESVGIYAAVQQVAYLPLLALAAITTLAVPRLSVLAEEGRSEAFLHELSKYVRILTVFGLCSLIIFIVGGNALLSLFGHNFSDGHIPLIILGVGYLIVLVGGLIEPLLQIRQAKRIVSVGMLALLALNIGLTYLLAPRYGAVGAAVAYTLSAAVIYAAQLVLLEGRVGIPYLSALVSGGGSDTSPIDHAR